MLIWKRYHYWSCPLGRVHYLQIRISVYVCCFRGKSPTKLEFVVSLVECAIKPHYGNSLHRSLIIIIILIIIIVIITDTEPIYSHRFSDNSVQTTVNLLPVLTVPDVRSVASLKLMKLSTVVQTGISLPRIFLPAQWNQIAFLESPRTSDETLYFFNSSYHKIDRPNLSTHFESTLRRHGRIFHSL